MSSRFGAVHRRNNKVKSILGGLLGVLVLTLIGLVWFAIHQNKENAIVIEQKPVRAALDPHTNSTYIPLFRIESGQKITEGMLKLVPMDKNTDMSNYITPEKYTDIFSGNYYATRMISPHGPLLRSDISTNPPLSAIEIPTGYRLITILVDGRSSVEGYAKPGARVDVLWTFLKDGEKMIGTLAHFVKVVSIAGNTEQQNKEQRVEVDNKQQTTASLLVTERQAKYIEFARSTGELSLSLVGGNEPNPEAKELVFVKMNDILGQQEVEEEKEEDYQGVMYSKDPSTGKTLKYVLKKGIWIVEKS